MQQQRVEPLVIAPPSGMMKFRRGYAWVLFAMIVVLAVFACTLWSTGRQGIAMFILGELFFLTGILWWFKRQNRERRTGDQTVPRPAIVLDEAGLSVLGSPTIGPILWEEIQSIQGSSFLGFPIIKLGLNYRAVRRRLGTRGRSLWMAWVPGGLGLNAVAFGGKGAPVAEQINTYRAQLSSRTDDPLQ